MRLAAGGVDMGLTMRTVDVDLNVSVRLTDERAKLEAWTPPGVM